MNNLAVLPNWKAGATPAERFEELANMARVTPDQFMQVAVVWSYEHEGRTKHKHLSFNFEGKGLQCAEAVGLLTIAVSQTIAVCSE